MGSYNQVTLIGNAGDAPKVLKKTEKGAFVRFSIATHKQYTNRQGKTVKTVQWHQVIANNGVGTFIANHLKKGIRVFVSGELNHSKWTDKQNRKRESIFISARSVDFLSGIDKKQPPNNEADDDKVDRACLSAFGEE